MKILTRMYVVQLNECLRQSLMHHFDYISVDYIFYIQRATASCPKIQRLNPLVAVHGTDGSLGSILQNKEEASKLLSQYDVVCLVGQRHSHVLAVDTICRELGIKCFAARAFGLLGLILFDLGPRHRFTEPPDALDLAPKAKSKSSSPRCGSVPIVIRNPMYFNDY